MFVVPLGTQLASTRQQFTAVVVDVSAYMSEAQIALPELALEAKIITPNLGEILVGMRVTAYAAKIVHLSPPCFIPNDVKIALLVSSYKSVAAADGAIKTDAFVEHHSLEVVNEGMPERIVQSLAHMAG